MSDISQDYTICSTDRHNLSFIIQTTRSEAQKHNATVYAYSRKGSQEVMISTKKQVDWIARADPDGSIFTKPDKLI